MLHLSEYVWTLRCVLRGEVVFNNFLLIDATDRSKICSDQKRFLSHEAYTPFQFAQILTLSLISIVHLNLGSLA